MECFDGAQVVMTESGEHRAVRPADVVTAAEAAALDSLDAEDGCADMNGATGGLDASSSDEDAGQDGGLQQVRPSSPLCALSWKLQWTCACLWGSQLGNGSQMAPNRL